MKRRITVLLFTISISVFAQTKGVLESLDFNFSELKKVKEAYNQGNDKRALQELLKIYIAKQPLYLKMDQSDLDYLKLNYPKDVAKVLETANQVLDQYFVFRDEWAMEKTNVPYQFKKEIDWSIIPFEDPEWCYMLNRHRYWEDLGRAYYLTGEEKYAKGFINQVTHWIDNNPISNELLNLSWRRIEAGIRCENWIKSFEYVKHSKHFTPQFLAKFLMSLKEHAEYLNKDFSNFSKTSNWGVLEFHGLFNVSQFLNDFKDADNWQRHALNNLETCINLQILDDGTQWEQSPMYHNEVFHCFMNVNLLAQRKHIKLPKDIVQKTRDMAYANIQWQKPNFHQPLLGDSDDTDLRGLLTLAAYLYQDSVLKSRAYQTFDFNTYCILGKDEMLSYRQLTAKQPEFLSVFQKSSGDFYMRNSWDENASYTSFHLKKLGCGHGHDNILHVSLFANGRDYLVDNGRYTYVNTKWRAFFKESKSHNTLGVDDLSNSVYGSSWSNKYDATSKGIETVISESFDYAEAENIAYERLENPVTMKRQLLYLKPNIWLLFDSFHTKGRHKFSQYFNFPDSSVELNYNTIETTYKKDNLRIQPIKDVEVSLKDSWFSSEYNLKTESKRAEIFNHSLGFTSFITLLYFPDQTKLKYEKIPVYDRNNKLLSDSQAEAINLSIEETNYTIMVVYNRPPGTHFYSVNNQIVSGEVVLIETKDGKTSTKVIK
ncbi:alginate lyase family protein [Aestuariibaculum sediminum]|uniref:Alginate lyase family protein n=1 Tax=Aestuariibaculum sediminum TaxID=2770637 RepID=A0A8J6U801_9FLAO|nr:alginate lyase family protein [Aestuariibaculum sediminum]MBD0832590.1 alginate lyase family protein [Aestuariibaculum sediminum]